MIQLTIAQQVLLREYYSDDMIGQLTGLIQPNDRIIFSPEREINFKAPTTEQHPAGKPEGLWYGVGPDWYNEITSNYRFAQSKYLHQIELNYSKILVISDINDLWDFTETFGSMDPSFPPGTDIGASRPYIHWDLVSQRCSGIEISPFLGKEKLTWGNTVNFEPNFDWYSLWDVASGCIWDASAIKSVHLIGDLDPEV
jgi:hypothetical protein